MILSSVSPSFQQLIYAMTDPGQMWTTLKTQLDSMNANAGPYILRAQLFREKHSTGPISAFFAKLMQYQSRLSSTDFKIQDIDLISHILSYGTLPPRFDSTVEVLRLQTNTNWSALTQILVNKEIQMSTLSETPPNITTTTAMVSNSRNQRNKSQGSGSCNIGRGFG
jgi:gag-polypeptide of LTR copia-type